MVTLGDDLRVRFQYLIQTVARNGTVALTPAARGQDAVSGAAAGARTALSGQALSGAYPEYFIYGPLVFSRATLEHLQSVYSPAMFARPALDLRDVPIAAVSAARLAADRGTRGGGHRVIAIFPGQADGRL